jgi:hypothetical protein
MALDMQTTLAALGLLLISASSPKQSPLVIVVTYLNTLMVIV